MKHPIVFTLVSLFAGFALATPKVGDSATYAGTFSGVNFVQTVELISFDKSVDSFQQETTTEQEDGQKTVDTEWVKSDDIFSAETGQYLIDNCTDEGGTIEFISVNTQKLKTCKLTTEDGGTVNLSAVPFGLVQLISSGWGQKLDSFKFGK